MKKRFYLFAALLGITLPMMAAIELSKSNPTYEQNFDGTATEEVLAVDETALKNAPDGKRSVSLAVDLPEGWKVRTSENGTSNIGVYSTGATGTTYVGGTSLRSDSKRGTWNLGKSQNSDRAIGGITSASTTGGAAVKCVNILCQITNTEAEAITSLDLSYAIEQYRQGIKNYKMTLYTSTTGESGSWTAVDDAFSLVFDNTVASATGAADDALPISTKSVEDQKLVVTIASSESLYLAWHIAAADGTEAGGAAALALDDVTITANYGEVNPDPEPEPEPTWGQSEFCNASDAQYESNNTKVALKWQTAYNGDVVIDILNGDNTFDAVYRNGGFEGDMAGFKVLSGEGFTTETAASEYFTRKGGADGTTTFRLVKKDAVTLPYPCKIKFTTNALAWSAKSEVSGELKGCYTFPTIEYTYYTHCQNLDTPTGIAISNTGRISFNEVSGADSYVVFVYNETGTLIHTQNVVNNEILDMVIMSTGTYTVKLIALKGEFASNKSVAYDWSVEAGKVYAKSKYCDWVWNTTDREGWPVKMTWVTEHNGNVTITLAPNGDQGEGKTIFRGGGMPIDRFKVNGEDASTYFSAAWENNVVTLTKSATPLNNGAVISYEGTVEYTTGTHTNAWPTLKITDYVYGTKCTSSDAVVPIITTFEKVSATVDAITFHVAASDVDDEGTPQAITYTLAGDNGFATTTITPDAEGNFTVEGLKKNRDYTFTLTATDPSSNQTVSTPVTIRMQFDATDNLALNKPAECGCSETGKEADKANDNNVNTEWGTYPCVDKATANIWTVDLGTIFDIDQIKVTCGGTQGATPKTTIYASWDKTNWVAIIAEQSMGNSGVYNFTSINAPARYLKLQSAGTGMQAVKEFEVYGLGYSTTDAIAPEVTVTEVSKTTNTATLKIAATDVDDAGVAHPVKSITISGDNGFETIENAVLDGEGNITLEGLKDNATYNFHVLVTDRVGLTAEQDIEVRVAFNNVNLALNMPSEAGIHQDANVATRANDGNEGTMWTSFGQGTSDQWWWTVDLGQSFNINRVRILFNDHAGTYNLVTSDDGSEWINYATNFTIDNDHIDYTIHVVTSARYFKFTSTAANVGIKEFEVYGTGYNDGDTEKPQITAAALVGAAGEDEATISVTATDNVGVYACRFVDEANAYNQTFEYIAGEPIVVNGLVPGTEYTFSVVALDRAGNESDPFVMTSFSTTANDNVPHTAAPVPTIPAARVTSIYSDTYPSAVKDGFQWNSWGGATEQTTGVIAGNNYIHYTGHADGQFGIGANFHDAETNAVGINISTRAALHVDVWSKEDYGQGIGITLNDNRLLLGYKLQAGWNSINVSLAELEGDNAADVLASLKWMKFTEINGKTIAIDNIYFYGVGISENAANTSNMETYDGQTVDVVLNRGFAAGTLYTLCLPFNMSAAQVEEAFGTDAEVWKLVSSEDRGSLIHIDFALQSNIEAGVPYLFNPSKDFASGTAINNVVLRNTTGREVKTDYFTMKGYVNPTDFTVADGYYFLAADKYLHTLGNDVTSPGLRSAFTISEGVDSAAARKPARVVLGTEVTTDMPAINAEVGVEKVMRNGQLYIIREGKMYNVQGQLVK